MQGRVKWYNATKGYGFILGEDGAEAFVHRSSLPIGQEVRTGDRVTYVVEDTARGSKAVAVAVLDTHAAE